MTSRLLLGWWIPKNTSWSPLHCQLKGSQHILRLINMMFWWESDSHNVISLCDTISSFFSVWRKKCWAIVTIEDWYWNWFKKGFLGWDWSTYEKVIGWKFSSFIIWINPSHHFINTTSISKRCHSQV
jgi:hypothetical protein